MSNIINILKKNNLKISELLKAILIVVLVGILFIIFYKNFDNNSHKKIPSEQNININDREILNRLNKLILLPENTQPNIAEILDIEALKEQQPNFFANAKNGDRIIIYPEMAIIFSVTENKIIKIGPVLNNVKNVENKLQ